MEIEMKPISLDARLEYLQHISENQQANTKGLPWLLVIGSCLLGASICGGIIYFLLKKEKPKENPTNTK